MSSRVLVNHIEVVPITLWHVLVSFRQAEDRRHQRVAVDVGPFMT